MRRMRQTVGLLRALLPASIAIAVALAIVPGIANARRRRHVVRGPVRPSGVLQVVLLAADPPGSTPGTYRTVRLIDSYGGKWESRPDSTGLAKFAGVPPGRALVSTWSLAADSLPSPRDTVWIFAGRTTVDTIHAGPSGTRP